MKHVQEDFLKEIYVRSKFSCVRSSHKLCARAHAHSLEGTLHLNTSMTSTLRTWNHSVNGDIKHLCLQRQTVNAFTLDLYIWDSNPDASDQNNILLSTQVAHQRRLSNVSLPHRYFHFQIMDK